MIREATLQDIGAIGDLGEEFAAEGFGAGYVSVDTGTVMMQCINVIKAPTMQLFLAEADGEIVGMIAGFVKPNFFNSEEIIGQELVWFVREEWRGSTVAIRLIRALEGWFQDQGADAILVANEQNIAPERTKEIYTRMGYEPYENFYAKEA